MATVPEVATFVGNRVLPGGVTPWRNAFGPNRTVGERMRGLATGLSSGLRAAGPLGLLTYGANRLFNGPNSPANASAADFRQNEAYFRGMGINSPQEYLDYLRSNPASAQEQAYYNSLGGYGSTTATPSSQITMPSFSQWPTATPTSGFEGIDMPYLQPYAEDTSRAGLPGIASSLEGTDYGPTAPQISSDYRAGMTRGVGQIGGSGRAPGSTFGVYHGVGGSGTSPLEYSSAPFQRLLLAEQ